MTSLASVAFAPQITAAAQRHGLDPRLLAAVAAQETGGPGSDSGANIVGDGGHGHGVFQIDDRWHAFASTPAAMDPAKNADYAASLLSGLLSRFGGNVRAALSAYNGGSPTATGTTTAWGGQVLGYADSVLAHEARLGGSTARDAAIADAPAAAASTNGLRSIATLLAASRPPASAANGASPSSLPQPVDHGSHDEAALSEDLGDDDPSQPAPIA